MDPGTSSAGFWAATIGAMVLKQKKLVKFTKRIIRGHGTATTQAAAMFQRDVRVTDPRLPHSGLAEELEDEELQPLMFDLIDTDQVAIIRSLIPRLQGLDRSAQIQFSIHATRMGSSSILQLFHRCGLLTRALGNLDSSLLWDTFADLATHAIQSESVSLSKVLLCWITASEINMSRYQKASFQELISKVLSRIIVVESQELFNLWKMDLATGFGVNRSAMDAAKALTFQSVIASTGNIPNRERILCDIWDEFRVLYRIKLRERSKILSHIADSSCSIALTQYRGRPHEKQQNLWNSYYFKEQTLTKGREQRVLETKKEHGKSQNGWG
ncbi:Nacht domain-containing protein [Fusarium globosum]|uniref:Nacht domain-containing protein n=1 Tax=Fusarium globosum TaxID=78864 RepID=A0A8H6D1H9_9HYPO|nr:Nacht domain-containing protein [Fusarium globosum]